MGSVIEGRRCPSISAHAEIEGERCPAISVHAMIEGHTRPAISTPLTERSMPKIGQITKRTQAASLITGIKKHLAHKKAHFFMGASFSTKDLIALFQSHLDALDKISGLRAALAGAVADERRLAKRTKAVAKGLKAFMAGTKGVSPVLFNDFGWRVPKRPGPKTVAGKLAGAEKTRATRAARGTMGKRQRKRSERGGSRV